MKGWDGKVKIVDVQGVEIPSQVELWRFVHRACGCADNIREL